MRATPLPCGGSGPLCPTGRRGPGLQGTQQGVAPPWTLSSWQGQGELALMILPWVRSPGGSCGLASDYRIWFSTCP